MTETGQARIPVGAAAVEVADTGRAAYCWRVGVRDGREGTQRVEFWDAADQVAYDAGFAEGEQAAQQRGGQG